MSIPTHLDNARQRMARWRLLRILYSGLPYPVGETLILEVLNDADLAMTVTQVRSGLRYLADKGYVDVKDVTVRHEGTHLEARLLPKGVDFVEYSVPDEDPGVARPDPV